MSNAKKGSTPWNKMSKFRKGKPWTDARRKAQEQRIIKILDENE